MNVRKIIPADILKSPQGPFSTKCTIVIFKRLIKTQDLEERFIAKVEVLVVLVRVDQLKTRIVENLGIPWQLAPIAFTKQNL